MGFIEEIAPLIIKYAPQYGIKVVSPIIAQAILESASGTSNKVMVKDDKGNIEWRHNYFGLKWRNNRCAISNDHFEEVTSEQRKDGTYYQKVDSFCKFKSMEDCVIGYFQWTNIPNYANLKGVTDPRTYLINIKADKYASSINYVDNVMNVVNKYGLTAYDTINSNNDRKENNKMVINVHAGHNPDGKPACGAIGQIKESTENRVVKDKVVAKLRSLGHTVYDCTCEDGKNKSDVLQKIVKKCNEHNADLDVSIHFNAGAADKIGNGETTGVEVFIYSPTSSAKVYADNICKSIAALGFKNRGVKTNSSLYVLKNTTAEALLIECCFVDDPDDVKNYNPEAMATAIVKGITGQTVAAVQPVQPAQTNTTATTNNGKLYRVQCGAYSQKANAEAQVKKLKEAGINAIIIEM